MTTPTLPARLDEIEARVKAATPGPWQIERVDHEHEITFEIGTDGGFFAKIYEHDFIDQGRNAKPTCELIANAPTDLAFLLAAVREAGKALDAIAFSRGTNAGSVNAYNFSLARETLARLEALARGER